VDRESSSVFGWRTSAFDYGNDGDPDIAYAGGLDVDLKPGAVTAAHSIRETRLGSHGDNTC
jgi:hypothetical protein